MCLAQNTFWHPIWSILKLTILAYVENVVENRFKMC